MIITHIRGNNVIEQLVLDRYINDKLSALIGDIYETLTGDNICDPELDKKSANILLRTLLPVGFPKKKAFETIIRLYHLSVTNTVMTVDPVAAYVLQNILEWYDSDFTLPEKTERIKLEEFVYYVGKYMGLTEEQAQEKKKIIPECMEDADGNSLECLLSFKRYDPNAMDALTCSELENMQSGFDRSITPFWDYVGILKNAYHTKEEQ